MDNPENKMKPSKMHDNNKIGITNFYKPPYLQFNYTCEQRRKKMIFSINCDQLWVNINMTCPNIRSSMSHLHLSIMQEV